MKSLLNLGKALKKVEQKTIYGGRRPFLGSDCYVGSRCEPATCNNVGGVCVSCLTDSPQGYTAWECRVFAAA